MLRSTVSAILLLVLTAVHGADPVGSPAPRPAVKKAATRDTMTVARQIDREISKALVEQNIPNSPQASDAEFLRRVYIDITGDIPTAADIREFLSDTAPGKRQKAIDELLADKDFGKNFGSIWYDYLISPNADNRLLVRPDMEQWLADRFNEQRGWDKIVYDILTAEGGRNENPATIFWFAQSVTAGRSKLKPGDAVSKATQRFLGVQYQCAECHDHPFTKQTQGEFWGMAAFFGQVDIGGGNKAVLREPNANPSIIEKIPKKPTVEIPETDGQIAEARLPDGTPYDPKAKLRPAFANWCVSPKNTQFAKATVNRMWAHFFGRGFVHPADDFRDNNPPSHPELLDALAVEFTESGYDLRQLIRWICNSQTYQRSSDATVLNANDDSMYSHMYIKAMTPVVLQNALETALEKNSEPTGKGNRKKKKQPKKPLRGGAGTIFDTSDEADDPEYSHGVPQVLHLMNSDLLSNSPIVQRVTKAGLPTERAIEELFLSILGRKPSAQEKSKMSALVADAKTPTKGYEDVAWVLLNSSEFVLNH